MERWDDSLSASKTLVNDWCKNCELVRYQSFWSRFLSESYERRIRDSYILFFFFSIDIIFIYIIDI